VSHSCIHPSMSPELFLLVLVIILLYYFQVERDFINLANAKVQYNAEHSKAHGVSLNCNVFIYLKIEIQYEYYSTTIFISIGCVSLLLCTICSFTLKNNVLCCVNSLKANAVIHV